jgi:hypothetical protein
MAVVMVSVSGVRVFGANLTPPSDQLCSLTPITPSTSTSASPAINADGTRIAFVSRGDLTGGNPDGNQELFLADTTTGSFTQLTHSTSGKSVEPAINATGTRIAFAANGEIFLATCGGKDTTPPVITVAAHPATLWPPNGKLVPVTVSGTVMEEPEGSGVNASTATYAVTDEYGSVQPSGPVTVAADGSYTFTIKLQASRHGNDRDGRQYSITVSAQDNAGNMGQRPRM